MMESFNSSCRKLCVNFSLTAVDRKAVSRKDLAKA